MSVLQISHYSKDYNGKKAVEDLSLDIQAGEIYGFIGHNGAGKTTTIKAVAGILPFTQGEILVDGVSVRQDPIACKRKIAYIPDNPDLYEFLSGIKYLNFIADLFRVPKKQREERIHQYAEIFGMTGDLGSSIGAYSHGMKQKLSLIAALIHEPKLMLLDEDFAVEDYAICMAKDKAELTEAFNGAIAQIKENGTLQAILDKYINGVEGAAGYVTPEGTEYPNGQLVMATNAYFPPYEYYEGETIVGIDAEFAKAICDILGYELVIEDMEFDSIITAVQSGKADFGAAGMTVTEDRLQNVNFTDSYCTGIQSVIVLK